MKDMPVSFRWLACIVAGTVLTAVGVPRLWLVGSMSLVLPPEWAFSAAYLSAIAGSECTYRMLRAGCFRRFFARLRKHPRYPAFLHGESMGTLDVFWARQLPVPGIVVSAALAGTGASPCAYALGTALGFLPSTALVALGMAAAIRADTLRWTALVLAFVALLYFAMRLFFRRFFHAFARR